MQLNTTHTERIRKTYICAYIRGFHRDIKYSCKWYMQYVLFFV